MFSYAAFLGRQPAISVAEIAALLPDCVIRRIVAKNVLIFESALELDSGFLSSLGGTVVLARSLGTGLDVVDIPKILSNELTVVKRSKVTFGLRTVGMQPMRVRQLYRDCKNLLKTQGRPSRYVGSDKKAALPVVLHDSDMIDGKHGCEIVIVIDENLVWIGKTVAAQDIDAYTKRDMDKPARDKHVGLLPPKLAQILLNLGFFASQGKLKTNKKHALPQLTVYDPFCGTGVIPLECLVRGWNVLASDKSKKAVGDTEKNLEWARKEYGIAKKDVTSMIFGHDVLKPFAASKEKVDMIVTETTLGPPLTRRPTLKDSQKMRTENEAIQIAFLKNCAQAFPGVPVVCTFPIWYHSKGQTCLEKVWKTVEQLGYEAILPSGTPAVDSETTLVYRRPDQFVGREIVVLKPPKS